MPLTFTSEKERQAHPVAGRISKKYWNRFWSGDRHDAELSDLDVSLLTTPLKDCWPIIEDIKSENYMIRLKSFYLLCQKEQQ